MLWIGLALILVAAGIFVFAHPPYRKLRVTWGPTLKPDPKVAYVTRKIFPWFSRNVTFFSTIYEGGPQGINDATLRHELVHVHQYRTKGWLWVWTHPTLREAEAHSAEQADYPQWEDV